MSLRLRNIAYLVAGMAFLEAVFALTTIARTAAAQGGPEPIRIEGIENVWRLGSGIYSGGDPGGTGGLEKLKALGIRTIVSVDGAQPDVKTARSLGIRYVHLPIGYEGIDEPSRLLLTRCIRELPKPIYVHCHHGKHRGPAAAAIMGRAEAEWSVEKAVEFMQRAGTSTDYPGLYAAVRNFRKPTAEELRASAEPLPESVDVPDMVDMMVRIDERFDRMKSWHKLVSESEVVKDHADRIDPVQEAIQLRELVRESARLPECRDRPTQFLEAFEGLEEDLTDWIEAIGDQQKAGKSRNDPEDALAAILKRASGRCVSCHKSFRDK